MGNSHLNLDNFEHGDFALKLHEAQALKASPNNRRFSLIIFLKKGTNLRN